MMLNDILSFALLTILYVVPVVCYTVYQVKKLKYSQTNQHQKRADHR